MFFRAIINRARVPEIIMTKINYTILNKMHQMESGYKDWSYENILS